MANSEAFYVVHSLGDPVYLAHVVVPLVSERLTKGSDGWVDDSDMLDIAWGDAAGQEITREQAAKIAADWGFELPTAA
jgi:hypothetical protein